MSTLIRIMRPAHARSARSYVLSLCVVDVSRQLEAPVRGQKIPDGGPPVGQRRQDRDDMFIQIDGSAEKQGMLQ